MTTDVTEAGHLDGWRVQAITDALGAQVVCSKGGEEARLSPPLADRAAAVALAERVVAEGFGGVEWERPVGNIIDLSGPLASRPYSRRPPDPRTAGLRDRLRVKAEEHAARYPTFDVPRFLEWAAGLSEYMLKRHADDIPHLNRVRRKAESALRILHD